jgi:hypothetical protein
MVDTLKTVDGRLQLQLPTDPYAHGGGLLPEFRRRPVAYQTDRTGEMVLN